MGSAEQDNSRKTDIAQAYSALSRKGYFADGIGGNEGYAGSLMTHHVPRNATSILEVGGATGLWMRRVLRERPALREVTVVELSDAAGACRERLAPLLEPRAGSRLSVLQEDFHAVADDLAPADVVASSYVADHMGDPIDYLGRLYDLAAPGGRVIAAEVVTRPGRPVGSVGLGILTASFLRLCLTHVRLGKLPPLVGVARSLPLYRLPDEPEFRGIQGYSDTYSFPLERWRTVQRAYPGATFHHLGMLGMLILPKPA